MVGVEGIGGIMIIMAPMITTITTNNDNSNNDVEDMPTISVDVLDTPHPCTVMEDMPLLKALVKIFVRVVRDP